MNLFTCTARIITTPRLSLYKKKALTQAIICLYNSKKKSLWYGAYTRSKGKLAKQIFNMYNSGDFVIIQGYISIKSKKVDSKIKNLKTKKFIILKITKIYPLKKILQ